MPEVAYQSPTTPAKSPLPSNKSSSVAIAESANPHNKRFEADDIAQKTSLATVVAQSPAYLSKLISKVLEEKLAQFSIKPNNQPNSTKPSGASEPKGAYRKPSRNTPRSGRAPLLEKATEAHRRLGWQVSRTKTTRLALRRMHVAGGVADQAIPKAIAPSVQETTSGTIR